MTRINFQSLMQDEHALRWQALDQLDDPCAVVTSRMELVYANTRCQSLMPIDWFAKRCYEALPSSEKLCALQCPTIHAVQTSDEITCCEETLQLDDGSMLQLGNAVIPLPQHRDDPARAILMFRHMPPGTDKARFERDLMRASSALLAQIGN